MSDTHSRCNCSRDQLHRTPVSCGSGAFLAECTVPFHCSLRKRPPVRLTKFRVLRFSRSSRSTRRLCQRRKDHKELGGYVPFDQDSEKSWLLSNYDGAEDIFLPPVKETHPGHNRQARVLSRLPIFFPINDSSSRSVYGSPSFSCRIEERKGFLER